VDELDVSQKNMPIPDYQSCMLPLLRFAGDGQEHQLKDAIQALADEFALSDEDRNEFLPSGQQAVFTNRVGWARTYLKKAALLSSPRRGFFEITDRGRSVLQENPPIINQKYLGRFPEFIEFKSIRREKSEENGADEPELALGQTPHEALESAYERLRSELAAEILASIKTTDPTMFENIVVELLVKMGYGGSRKDAGRAITSRQSAGTRLLAVRRFRSLQARYRDSEPARVFLLQLPTSPRTHLILFRGLILRSF